MTAAERETEGRVAPSFEGRANLTDVVSVYAHHSSVHDGINVEIEAPAGTQITVHLNDGLIADVVVPCGCADCEGCQI